MKKQFTTYRYAIRVGPKFVYAGVTDDIDRSRIEAKSTWPSGTFFQVGEKTSFVEASAWMTKNVLVSGGARR